MANRAVLALLGRPEGYGMHHSMFERKADVDVAMSDIQEKNLVLVGRPTQNSVVAQMAPQLPVQFTAGGIRIKNVNYTGDDVRWSVVYPNPLNPENYVLLTNENPFVNSAVPLVEVYKNDYLVYKPATPTSGNYKVLGSGIFNQAWE